MDEIQRNILRAMASANPDKPGDLTDKLRKIDPVAALLIAELTRMKQRGNGD